ncbi:MAG: GPW/gp25 family protein [Schleiferiaceae bacterium]|jgi:phage baseplate assembly protein W|nr:GPW/gp25 family protein [Schleiferiaceae bacterium]
MKRDFLGKGWSFPPRIAGGTTTMVKDELDIKQSLEILLNTLPGERIMLPKYGCDLKDVMFEALNTTLVTYIKDLIETAILYYEPRIEVKNINIIQELYLEGRLDIEVDFVIRATNSRLNFVYPFYKTEGTEIKE